MHIAKQSSFIGLLLTALICYYSSNSRADTALYIAPTARGNGTGTLPENAASYVDTVFWDGVRTSLSSEAVTVRWLDGQYNSQGLILTEMGHPLNKLTLIGDTDNGAILNAPTTIMLRFLGVQNTLVKDLNFRGETTYFSFQISSNGSTPSRNIEVDSLSFVDQRSILYGALGIARDTYDVSVRNCTFSNIGYDSHAHHVYNTSSPHHISLYNNTFTDCMGDYVRFRHDTDYGVVIDNNFLSQSNPFNRPFVAMPLFNDVDPGDEIFATHYLIRDNNFTYLDVDGTAHLRSAIRFGHWGYDPPGYNHLMTVDEGFCLTYGTTQQKYDLLLANTGIDGNEVRVYDNTFDNEYDRGSFASFARYGSVSKGWEGYVDVHDTWNHNVPDLSPDAIQKHWNFDSSDNGGAGWVENSAQALADAGWTSSSGVAADNKTYIANGLLVIADFTTNTTVNAGYRYEYMPKGMIEWEMAIAGNGSEFRLLNGREHERGLSVFGVQLVDFDTIRILGDMIENCDMDFTGVDFGQINKWQWIWASDPDGINGYGSLRFQDPSETWHTVYWEQEFDYNVVPDYFWVKSIGGEQQTSYVVLDSLKIVSDPTVPEPSTAILSLIGLIALISFRRRV